MDDINDNKLVNQFLQNVSIGAGPNRMPIIPSSSTTMLTPPVSTPPAQVNTSTNTYVATNRADVLRVPKRVPQQQYIHHYNMSSPAGNSLNGIASYGGAYNNHLYNRPYMNNMGIRSNYNPYNSFGQPSIAPKFQNPIINAAAESSRPAFDSIWSVVESFNALSMMLETSLGAMQMSFQALLTVAENFTHLKTFVTKLYSTIVSFKLLRWFLTKLLFLIRMVRGDRGTSTEETVWTALSDVNQVAPYDGLSWPVAVFSGLLVATPYFVYKLLNSVTPLPVFPPASQNTKNGPVKIFILKSLQDWSSEHPNTIPLVKGAIYMSSRARLNDIEKNGDWLLVDDMQGKSGFVPSKMLKIKRPMMMNSQPQSVTSDISNMTPNVVPRITEQIPPLQSISPIIDVHNNLVDLPHPLLSCDIKNDN